MNNLIKDMLYWMNLWINFQFLPLIRHMSITFYWILNLSCWWHKQYHSHSGICGLLKVKITLILLVSFLRKVFQSYGNFPVGETFLLTPTPLCSLVYDLRLAGSYWYWSNTSSTLWCFCAYCLIFFAKTLFA